MRRSFKILLIFLSISIFAIVSGALYFSDSFCTESYIPELASPDYKYFIKVRETNCGSLVPYVSYVELREARGARWDSVYTYRGLLSDVEVAWVGNGGAKIEMRRCGEEYLKKESVGNVNFEYVSTCR